MLLRRRASPSVDQRGRQRRALATLSTEVDHARLRCAAEIRIRELAPREAVIAVCSARRVPCSAAGACSC